MKQLFIISLAILTSVTHLYAEIQQPQYRLHQPRHERRVSGEMKEFQIGLLIKQLKIEEQKKDIFAEIYSEYCDELELIRPKEMKLRGLQNSSDADIEAQILNSFEIAENSTAIKKRYYKQFKTVLTPRQILKMYNIERQFSEKLNSELQNRANRGNRQRQNNEVEE